LSIFSDFERSIKNLFIEVLSRLLISHKLIYYFVYPLFTLVSRQKEAEIISEILLKAASEAEFRNSLIKDPSAILEKYNISNEAKYIIRKSIIDLTQ
jgi:hypothetical protein